jgi:hypothetical protein
MSRLHNNTLFSSIRSTQQSSTNFLTSLKNINTEPTTSNNQTITKTKTVNGSQTRRRRHRRCQNTIMNTEPSPMSSSMASTAPFSSTAPPLTSVGDGCCPTCGIQLYKIKKGLISRKPIAKPLTVDGHVIKGHCLACDDARTSNSRPESPVDVTSNNSLSSSLECGETVYIGDFNIYGQRHGPGELIWNNGDRYAGNFFNGHRDGHGTLFFGDGTSLLVNLHCHPC